MFHDSGINPNQTLEDPPPDARVTVAALKKGPEATTLLDSEEHSIGGTWFQWLPVATEPVFAVVEISSTAPVQNADGQWLFPGGPTLGRAVSSDYATTFPTPDDELYLENLLPGNEYFAVLRLSSPNGDWQFLLAPPSPDNPNPSKPVPFKARRRVVGVTYKMIHIVNDGSPGDNDASFRIWIFDGDDQEGFNELGRRPISDRPSPGEESLEFINLEDPPISWPPLTFGPKTVDPNAHHDLRLLTRGLAEDDFGSDDPAANFLPGPGVVPGHPNTLAEFRYPIGKRETIPADDDPDGEPAEHDVDARPLEEGDEFAYNVEIAITVSYTD